MDATCHRYVSWLEVQGLEEHGVQSILNSGVNVRLGRGAHAKLGPQLFADLLVRAKLESLSLDELQLTAEEWQVLGPGTEWEKLTKASFVKRLGRVLREELVWRS